jgi:hypothetical protein
LSISAYDPLRRVRGYLLAGNPRRSVLQYSNEQQTLFSVPSENEPGVRYDVFIDVDGQWVCTPCEDFAKNRRPCKHIFEVLDRYFPDVAPPVDPRLLRAMIMDSGAASWYADARRMPKVAHIYSEGPAESTRMDHALEIQDDRVQEALADLARKMNRRHPHRGVGRPPLPVGDRVFVMIYRGHQRKSIRRFRPTLGRLAAAQLIAFAPRKTAIVGYNTSLETTRYLIEAIDILVRPFRLMEDQVIADATGFSPFYVSNWRDSNYGEINYRSGTSWFKQHVLIGRRSKAILAFAFTPHRGEGVGDDSNLIPMLDDLRRRGFERAEVAIADNVYLTKDNIEKCKERGLQLVGPLKPRNFDKKTGLPRKAVAEIAAFKEQNPEAYDELTRARQAVEGVFSNQKRDDNHLAAIGTREERQAHRDLIDRAQLATDNAENDHLQDEAAAAALYTSRVNEFLVRVAVQILKRTVATEQLYNVRISYEKDLAFPPVRECSDESTAA